LPSIWPKIAPCQIFEGGVDRCQVKLKPSVRLNKKSTYLKKKSLNLLFLNCDFMKKKLQLVSDEYEVSLPILKKIVNINVMFL